MQVAEYFRARHGAASVESTQAAAIRLCAERRRELMSIKYASTPQLRYDGGGHQIRLQIRVPAGTYPIHTAPENTVTAVVLYENDGRASWGLHHGDSWRRVSPFKNQDGSVSWRMDGTLLNPVAWSPKPLERKR